MLIRNPYDKNHEDINSDEYLDFEDFFEKNLERTFPPFFSPNNQPGPPFQNPWFGPNPKENKPPSPTSPSNPNNTPIGSPPSYTPKQPDSKSSNQNMLKVSPGSIRPCLYQYVYVWQTNGSSYWAWFTRIDRTTASGYRWNGWRWVYFGVDLKRIASFECYGRKDANTPSNIDNVISNIETQKLSPAVFDIEYPFINDIEIEDASNIINYEILGVLEDLLRNQVLVPEKVDFEKVESDYEIPLDGYGLLSVVMSISTLVKGEKKPRITFDSITLDLNTANAYDFDSLFNPKSNYKEVISKIAMELAKKLKYKLVVPYEGITENQKYYLTPEELILYYQVDEYTPANQGLFRIPIPYKLLTQYLSPESPINKILNPSNLITVPSTEGSTEMSPEYLGTYTGVVPEEESETAMSPEYMGTYNGKVPKN